MAPCPRIYGVALCLGTDVWHHDLLFAWMWQGVVLCTRRQGCGAIAQEPMLWHFEAGAEVQNTVQLMHPSLTSGTRVITSGTALTKYVNNNVKNSSQGIEVLIFQLQRIIVMEGEQHNSLK